MKHNTKQFDELTTTGVSRRELLRKAMAGSAFGLAALAIPNLASAQNGRPVSEQVAELYQMYAAFLNANSYGGDIDALAQLWADDATLTLPNGATLTGKAAILGFFVHNAPGFTHDSVALSALFKAQFDVHGSTADFSVEHFYVDRSSHVVFASTHGMGKFKKVHGTWLLWKVVVGPASL